MPLSQPTTTVKPSRKARGRVMASRMVAPVVSAVVAASRAPYAPVKASVRMPAAAAGGRWRWPLDGHFPFVAGDVPVEFVVVFEEVELRFRDTL